MVRLGCALLRRVTQGRFASLPTMSLCKHHQRMSGALSSMRTRTKDEHVPRRDKDRRMAMLPGLEHREHGPRREAEVACWDLVFPAWCAVNVQPHSFLTLCPLAPPWFCPEVPGASALSCKLQLTLWLLPLKPRRGESNRTINDGSRPFSDFSGTLRREQ